MGGGQSPVGRGGGGRAAAAAARSHTLASHHTLNLSWVGRVGKGWVRGVAAENGSCLDPVWILVDPEWVFSFLPVRTIVPAALL